MEIAIKLSVVFVGVDLTWFPHWRHSIYGKLAQACLSLDG